MLGVIRGEKAFLRVVCLLEAGGRGSGLRIAMGAFVEFILAQLLDSFAS